MTTKQRQGSTVSPNVRRSLSQIGGDTEVWCDEAGLHDVFEAALRVESDDTQPMRHVHGFHSYPARMHPDTAARLVAGLTTPGQVVLDPFSGSGTVLVEARLLGRVAYGVDANPLAVALASLKLNGLKDPAEQELLLATAAVVAEYADERRRAKAGPSKRYNQAQRSLFPPHVLLELDGIAKGIAELCAPALKPALELVVSSLLTKVSLRSSDTNEQQLPRRIASGFTIRFFQKKTEELVRRLTDYSRQIPDATLKMGVKLGDARSLPMNDGHAHAIITSPPYPGVYDYVEHHRLRLEWLGLDARHLEQHEIGAHRHFAQSTPVDAEARWAEQLGACLDEMRRVLVPGGKAALLIADSVVAKRAFYADRALCQLAPKHGMRVVGGASQRRGHYHAPTRDAFREAPRREHLILLTASAPVRRR
jgi:DNA modification methylase